MSDDRGLEVFVPNRTGGFVRGGPLAPPVCTDVFIIQLSLLVPRGAVVSVIAIRAEADRPRGRIGLFRPAPGGPLGPLERATVATVRPKVSYPLTLLFPIKHIV